MHSTSPHDPSPSEGDGALVPLVVRLPDAAERNWLEDATAPERGCSERHAA